MDRQSEIRVKLYYVEMSYNDYEAAFLGVFSTHEKAVSACESKNDDGVNSLEWQARGDLILATNGQGYQFTIMPLIVDEAVTW